MKQVKIIDYASDICWWMGCKNQICPVLDTYEPTGFIKIRIIRVERGSENEPFEVEGWIDPKYVMEMTTDVLLESIFNEIATSLRIPKILNWMSKQIDKIK